MGRPERPLDPQAGPVQRFAFDLRALREQSGRPSYQELAKRAHYAPTTLSEAAKGEKLPTLEVARAFVKACDGDVDAWDRRWWELHHQLQLLPPGGGADVVVTDPARATPERGTATVTVVRHGARRARRPWLAAVAVAVMFVASSGGVQSLSRATSSRQNLLPLSLLRGADEGGGYMRVWMLSADRAQAVQLVSSAMYERKGKVGDCYAKQERGTVPVWHYSRPFKVGGYQQHLYTIETDPRRDEALKWGWTARDPDPLCYVYAAPAPGTRPLHRKRENSPDTGNAVGDGHGHVYTRDPRSFDSNGFSVDQVWYLPAGNGPS